jgi:hypothetical protein
MLRSAEHPMNITRTVVLGVSGGALAAWVAVASTSGTRPAVAPAPSRPTAVEKSGEELAAEIGRLHDRLHPTALPTRPARNLFEFTATRPAHAPALAAQTQLAPAAPAAAPAPAPLALIGVAEDGGVRTAVVSGFGQVFLVKEGEQVTDRYKVRAIESSAIELDDASGGAGDQTIRLVLK